MSISSFFNTKRPYITLFFLTIQTILFFYIQFIAPSVFHASANSPFLIYHMGGEFAPVMVFHNEWWRLFTPIFIHIGWEHFIFNSLTLYFIGRQIESLFGPLRFFFLYLLSGLVGNIISFAMNNGVDSSVSAGASTSLFGLFAAFGALRFFFKDNRIIVQLANQYFIFIAINLAFNLFESSVDMSGHVGGLIGGFLLSIILGIPFQMDHFPKSKRLLALLAITAISAASIVFGISKF